LVFLIVLFSGGFPMMDAYLNCGQDLIQMTRNGNGNSVEAEELRNQMDYYMSQMSEQPQQDALRKMIMLYGGG